jgi:uncharacterized protein YbjQ (UPF0145 family)
LQNKNQTEHQAQLAQLDQQHQQHMSHTNQLHSDVVLQLSQQHQHQLSEANVLHQSELGQVNKQLQQALSMLDHKDQEMSALTRSHQAAMSQMRNETEKQHSQAIEALRFDLDKTHANAVTSLRHELDLLYSREREQACAAAVEQCKADCHRQHQLELQERDQQAHKRLQQAQHDLEASFTQQKLELMAMSQQSIETSLKQSLVQAEHRLVDTKADFERQLLQKDELFVMKCKELQRECDRNIEQIRKQCSEQITSVEFNATTERQV